MIRGEIYRIRPLRAAGHEQQGSRYGVVVQANELLPRSVVLIAPTSRSAPRRPLPAARLLSSIHQHFGFVAGEIAPVDRVRDVTLLHG